MTRYRLVGRYQRFGEHTVRIFRGNDDSVCNETKVVGSRSVQFRVTIVAQQSFHATVCLYSSVKPQFPVILNRRYASGFLCM
jgi:hypothetical protein